MWQKIHGTVLQLVKYIDSHLRSRLNRDQPVFVILMYGEDIKQSFLFYFLTQNLKQCQLLCQCKKRVPSQPQGTNCTNLVGYSMAGSIKSLHRTNFIKRKTEIANFKTLHVPYPIYFMTSRLLMIHSQVHAIFLTWVTG